MFYFVADIFLDRDRLFLRIFLSVYPPFLIDDRRFLYVLAIIYYIYKKRGTNRSP